jgi:D-sedoheptulose 7-phosphate isomerase
MTSFEHERLAATRIEEALEAAQRLLEDGTPAAMAKMANALVTGFRGGGKLLVFGNGGSAEGAQHIAAELVGRLRLDRPPLPAVALVEGAAVVTALANDYTYAEVFARQVQGLGRPGDLALALSTSGRSENLLRAVDAARRGGLTTLAMTGPDDSPLGEAVDLCLKLPGADPARIQECQLVAAHIVCELVERELPAGAPPAA